MHKRRKTTSQRVPITRDPLEMRIQQSQMKQIEKRKRLKRKKQMRKRRIRFAVIVFILLLILLCFLVNFVKRKFFTSHLGTVPTLRYEANQAVKGTLLVTNVGSRNLTSAEKESDVNQLIEYLQKIPAINSQSKQDGTFETKITELKDKALSSTNDDEFFSAVSELVEVVQDPLTKVITLDEFVSLQNANGFGFFEKDSPYLLAISNQHSMQRYQKMVTADYGKSIMPKIEPKEPTEEHIDEENNDGENTVENSSTAIPTITELAKNKAPENTPKVNFHSSGKFAVIDHLSFSDSDISNHINALREIFQQVGSASTIIIDLRGNTGTSQSYWTDCLLPFISSGNIGTSSKVLFTSGFDEYVDYLSVKENIPQFDLQDTREPLPSQVSQNIKNALSDLNFGKEITFSVSETKESVVPSEVILLVDKNTSGGAETFADFCKRTRVAEIAGTNTAGGSWDLPPFLIPLKYSGLVVSVHPTVSLNVESTDLERNTGVSPTIALSSSDLLAELLGMLQ